MFQFYIVACCSITLTLFCTLVISDSNTTTCVGGSFNNVEPFLLGFIFGAFSAVSPPKLPATSEPVALSKLGNGAESILLALATLANTAPTPEIIAGILAGNGTPAPDAPPLAMALAVSIAISATAMALFCFSSFINLFFSAWLNFSPAFCFSFIRFISLVFT